MLQQALEGAVAGLLATAPMTVAMEAGFRQLPRREQYPLPPREITSEVGRAAGVWQELSETEKQAVTLTAHFAYGAAAGSLYGALVPPEHQNRLTGAAYGMAVWTSSYLGMLPALGLLSSATEHPPKRSALMIAAHLVWGAALGGMLKKTSCDKSQAADSPAPEKARRRAMKSAR